MKKTWTIPTAALVLGLAALGGCGGLHSTGKYTDEQRNAAKQKLDGLKAGLEYQTAMGDFQAGDFPKALKSVETSLSMNDKVAKSWTLRGRIMLEMGNLEQSMLSFNKAEELDASYVETQYFLGVLNERLERKDEALARYMKAAELDRGNPQYATASAELMIDLGKLDEAKAFLETRGPTMSDNAAIRQVLGHIAMIMKDPAAAARLFNEARLLSPEDTTILEDLVRAQIALSRFADAEVNLQKLLKDTKVAARRDLQHLRAKCLVETERNVEAREILIRLCNDQAGSADVQAWNDLGQVSYKLNDLNRVRQASSKLIAIAPRQPEGYLLKALWERKRGDNLAARDSVQAAIAREPSTDAYLMMAAIQRDLHDDAGAVLTLKVAVSRDPASQTARQMLEQIATATAAVDTNH